MPAVKTVCRLCGKEIAVAGFEEWELDDILCIKCKTLSMPTMGPEEQEKLKKQLEENRKG